MCTVPVPLFLIPVLSHLLPHGQHYKIRYFFNSVYIGYNTAFLRHYFQDNLPATGSVVMGTVSRDFLSRLQYFLDLILPGFIINKIKIF